MDVDQPTASGDSSFPGVLSVEGVRAMQRRESANLLDLISRRSLGVTRRNPQHKLNRDIHTAIPLTQCTVLPAFNSREIIVSWSPDGSKLICFSHDFNAVRVYNYRGVNMSRNEPEEKVLSSLFDLDFEVKLRPLQLNAVYFTACGRFLVVVTAAYTRETREMVEVVRLFTNNETMPLTGNLEDFVFCCIDLQEKRLADHHHFRMDRIGLEEAVNICGSYLQITSLHYQKIYILHIHPESGNFYVVKEIGPSVVDDDGLRTDAPVLVGPGRAPFYTGFRQMIMTFLFIRAKEAGKVSEFLRKTAFYNSLRISRAYLFEDHHILIRMLEKDIERPRQDGSILDVFEEHDERFYKWAVEHSVSLQAPQTSEAWPGAGNFTLHAHWKMTKGFRRGKQRHSASSLRVLLSQLPLPIFQPFKISAQSPYLDPHLFKVNDKMISAILSGRFKIKSDELKFHVARTKKFLFQLPFSDLAKLTIDDMSLLLHPRDPIALAFQVWQMQSTVAVFQPPSERD